MLRTIFISASQYGLLVSIRVLTGDPLQSLAYYEVASTPLLSACPHRTPMDFQDAWKCVLVFTSYENPQVP